jgi:uncharacterized membrane protein YedE/YeeE
VAATRSRTKRLIMLAAIVILGIIGREFFNAFYLFRELLFVVSFAALGVFLASCLMVLVIVFYSAWQHLTTHLGKTQARAPRRERLGTPVSHPIIPRGVYERESRIKA